MIIYYLLKALLIGELLLWNKFDDVDHQGSIGFSFTDVGLNSIDSCFKSLDLDQWTWATDTLEESQTLVNRADGLVVLLDSVFEFSVGFVSLEGFDIKGFSVLTDQLGGSIDLFFSLLLWGNQKVIEIVLRLGYINLIIVNLLLKSSRVLVEFVGKLSVIVL